MTGVKKYSPAKCAIVQFDFGKLGSGHMTHLYILRNSRGMEAAVTDYGARLVQVKVPAKQGRRMDVVLGYDSAGEYEKDPYFFGATVGRNANRIKDAEFTLNGIKYYLQKNENQNNNHSGPDGYQMRVWTMNKADGASVCFSLTSPHLDQGFPGEFKISVTYMLTESNELVIHYEGLSSKDTVVNMTHHSYFNLEGHGSGDILGQYLKLDADMYSPISDNQCIPSGSQEPVKGTPMDFLQFKKIGRDIHNDFPQLKLAGDYNHNFIINKKSEAMHIFAEAYSEKTGIYMAAETNLPAVQFYAGRYIGDTLGKKGCRYTSRSGFCLEAQYTPNAINEQGEVKPILRAGEWYDKAIMYRFDVK